VCLVCCCVGTYANLVKQAKSKQKILDKMYEAGLTQPVAREQTFQFNFPGGFRGFVGLTGSQGLGRIVNFESCIWHVNCVSDASHSQWRGSKPSSSTSQVGLCLSEGVFAKVWAGVSQVWAGLSNTYL
jgi:hypothetical protein